MYIRDQQPGVRMGRGGAMPRFLLILPILVAIVALACSAPPATSVPSTSSPTSTQTPEPSQWTSTGNWYQDLAQESIFNAAFEAQGVDTSSQVATLDANPAGWGSDLRFSLGCITGQQLGYLIPYAYVVPPSVDTYVVGMWNDEAGSWVEDGLGWYTSPVITDDGSGIYLTSRAQLRQIIAVLETANENQNPDLVLAIRMFDSTNADARGLWGQLDPTGLQDVLQYLPCF